MTIAATQMTSQPGETLASHTPIGDMTAPPTPSAKPSLGTQVFARACATTPEMDVGMMANRLVAVLASGLMPNARRKMGTMMVPPPTPRSPDITPTNTPAKAGAMKAANTSIAPRRLPYSAMFRRISLVTPGSTPAPDPATGNAAAIFAAAWRRATDCTMAVCRI